MDTRAIYFYDRQKITLPSKRKWTTDCGHFCDTDSANKNIFYAEFYRLKIHKDEKECYYSLVDGFSQVLDSTTITSNLLIGYYKRLILVTLRSGRER